MSILICFSASIYFLIILVRPLTFISTILFYFF
nr:MAG TPA: hypothetical protein [Caudoviricetes sp.]